MSLGWLDSLMRDVVVGWGSLRRSPGITAVVMTSLAIVLGANTAIFALADAMYLRRLDLPHAEQLVRVDALRDGHPFLLPYSAFLSVRSAAGVPDVAAFRYEPVEITTTSGDDQTLWLELVTGNYFDLVGVKPLVGRTIDAADERSAAQVAVVSEDYWRRHLGARSDVLGQTLHVDDKLFIIVGVMPARYRGLHFAHSFEISAPFTVSPIGFTNTRAASTTIVARLDGQRERRTQEAAQSAAIHNSSSDAAVFAYRHTARAVETHIVDVDDPPAQEDPRTVEGAPGLTVRLTDASRGLAWGQELRARYRAALTGVGAAVLMLLLIGCANVASLQLVRGEWRAREFAIRRSLGASIWRVRRQLFVEASELCLVGGAAGFLLAWMGTTLLARSLPASARALGDVIEWHTSARVIVITLAITAFCAIVTSMWPARRAGRDDLVGAFSGTRPPGSAGWTGQRVLVIGQISLALVLITAAWLFVATTRNLTRSAGGYGSRSVLLARMDARQLPDSNGSRASAFEGLRQNLLRLSGVTSVAYAMNAPLSQDGLLLMPAELPGSRVSGMVSARLDLISPDFFTATGTRIAHGRDFTGADDARSAPVAIVSESFERRYYGGRSAIGSILSMPPGSNAKQVRIVGVVRDAHYDRNLGRAPDLRNPATEIVYVPFAQSVGGMPDATLIVRADADPAALLAPIRRAVEQYAGIRLKRVTTVGAWLDDAAARERFSAALATAFGGFAVTLAAIGVLGVLSFQVARRTKEIGVRMALGAQSYDTVGLVLRQTLGMVVAALAFGIPCAIGAVWLVRSQLYGVAPWDPRAVLASAGAIVVVAVAASLVPSYRAARVDPIVALRQE